MKSALEELAIKEDQFIKITYGSMVFVMVTLLSIAGAFWSLKAETASLREDTQELTERTNMQRDAMAADKAEVRQFREQIYDTLTDIKVQQGIMLEQIKQLNRR